MTPLDRQSGRAVADAVPSERITLAGIGMGIQGTSNLRTVLGHPEVHVIAVCDVHETQLARGKQVVDDHYGNSTCAAYKDFRQLLARDDLDAVLVCTPDHWHPLIALEAARRGKHMYCEKPLGWSFRAAQAVRKEVQANRGGVSSSARNSDPRQSSAGPVN